MMIKKPNIFFVLIFPFLIFARSWQVVNSPTVQNLARLDMVDEQFGVAVSYDGLILKYDGKSWHVADSLQNISARYLQQRDTTRQRLGDIYTISMQSRQSGWMAVNQAYLGAYYLFEYSGGQWQIRLKNIPVKLRAFSFAKNGTGLAVGGAGAMSFHNGIWQFEHLPVVMDFRAVQIISSGMAIIAGSRGTILKRTDNNWQKLRAPRRTLLRDLYFTSENDGWLIGNRGTILHYTDGGIENHSQPVGEDLWCIDMLSADHGFIAGENGIIFEYNGMKWQRIDSPTNADLHDIEMLDESNGWIVGAWGTILKYGTISPQTDSAAHKLLLVDQVHLGSSYLMDRIGDIRGVTVSEFNNDGLPDIYLTGYRSLNHLLLNRGDGYYEDYTIPSGTGGSIETRVGRRKYEMGALAADFDRDGDRDLFLGGQRGTSRYFINNGSAHFEDITSECGLPATLDLVDGVIADLDRNGYPDLILADERRGLRILMNRKYNHFAALENLPAEARRAPVSVSVADLNEDDKTDIVVVYQHDAPRLFSRKNEKWQVQKLLLENGIWPDFINSLLIADFNSDARLDIFVCTDNGQDALLLKMGGEARFVDVSAEWGIRRVGRSYSAVAEDFDNDGDLDLYVSRALDDLLYINENNSRFIESSKRLMYSKAGYLSGVNMGAAALDFDNDLDRDLIIGNLNNWSSLLENTKNDSHAVNVILHGVQDTDECFGAKVWVRTGYRIIGFREVNPTQGMFSQTDRVLHFGLGKEKEVEIDVQFPNGTTSYIRHVQPGQTIHIYQAEKFQRWLYAGGRQIARLMHRPEIPIELVKLMILFIIIILSVQFVEKRYQWQPSRTAIYVLATVLVYGIVSFLLYDTGGWSFHTIPALMIIFSLLVLISVNEQIRKTSAAEQRVQQRLQQAGAELSRSADTSHAVEIAMGISRLVHPFRHIAFYIYYPFGNYLLLNRHSGDRYPQNISISWQDMSKLTKMETPVTAERAASIFKNLKRDDLIFPLVHQKEFLGMVMLALEETTVNRESVLQKLEYLFDQLAATIANICLRDAVQDQQKLAAIGTFSSGLIHNLKNPIDGLRMMIEALRNEMPETAQEREYIDELYEGVLKLKSDLLHSFDFIRIKDAQNERIAIGDLLNETLKKFEKYSIPKIVRETNQQEGYIKGDRQQLVNALESLVENAMEAAGNDGTVKVSSCCNNGEVKITISDDGRGMTRAELENLSRIFYSTRGSGRGLGLTVTRSIIENHKGHIELQTEEGKGTRFTIVFPGVEK